MRTYPPRLDSLITSLSRVSARQENFPFDTVLLNRLIHLAQRQLEAELSQVLAQKGLLVSHWMVLALLFGGDAFKRRPQELSMAIGQSGPNTTKTTTFLIERGWVLRVPDPDNKRSCWMVLTPEGQALVKRLMPVIWARYEASLSPLSPAEKNTMIELLLKLFAAGSEAP